MDVPSRRRYSESLERELTIMFEPKEADETPVKKALIGDEGGG